MLFLSLVKQWRYLKIYAPQVQPGTSISFDTYRLAANFNTLNAALRRLGYATDEQRSHGISVDGLHAAE